jgi:Glyoxalase-like domain
LSALSWVTAFLDLPVTTHDPAVGFWREVTGYDLSAPRGDHREFATLEPPDGDAFLKVQRVLDGPGGIHLDLHSASARGLASLAVSLGAVEIADHGYVVLRSPGGLVFCCVEHPASRRPAPATWPDGSRSLVDQVCLDIPPAAFEEECAFWASLTGWSLHASPVRREFAVLARPAGQPLRFLLQRLDQSSTPVRAHLDLASDDRVAEVHRHALLGATVLADEEHWTVLRDVAGAAYCVTDRDPGNGLLRAD